MTATLVSLPRNAYWVTHPGTGTRTFVPPLTLRPLPPALRTPSQLPRGHGFVAETGIQGHTLAAFSWNNLADVRSKRFAPGTPLPSQLIQSPPDQGNCGSCWIVSAVTMSSDRLAIATRSVPLALDILDPCCETQNGCDGGDSAMAFGILQKQTLMPQTCNPYHAWCSAGYHCTYEGTTALPAPPECNCSTRPQRRKAQCKTLGQVDSFRVLGSIQAVQDEIFQNGPVVVGFQCTDVLVKTYNCTGKNSTPFDGRGTPLGGHAVVIVGWGYDVATQKGFWVVRNSWGTRWNGDGYWTYLWGCGLENSGISAPVAWTVVPTAAARAAGLDVRAARFSGSPIEWALLATSVLVIVLLAVRLGAKAGRHSGM